MFAVHLVNENLRHGPACGRAASTSCGTDNPELCSRADRALEVAAFTGTKCRHSSITYKVVRKFPKTWDDERTLSNLVVAAETSAKETRWVPLTEIDGTYDGLEDVKTTLSTKGPTLSRQDMTGTASCRSRQSTSTNHRPTELTTAQWARKTLGRGANGLGYRGQHGYLDGHTKRRLNVFDSSGGYHGCREEREERVQE